MVSVLSQTSKYILQPRLIEMHRESLEWLSAAALWKHELSFFQKLLDDHCPKCSDVAFKQQVDHFQHLITYYNGELVDSLRKKLRNHESDLARMLSNTNESDTRFITMHDEIMAELKSFHEVWVEFKSDLYKFIG